MPNANFGRNTQHEYWGIPFTGNMMPGTGGGLTSTNNSPSNPYGGISVPRTITANNWGNSGVPSGINVGTSPFASNFFGTRPPGYVGPTTLPTSWSFQQGTGWVPRAIAVNNPATNTASGAGAGAAVANAGAYAGAVGANSVGYGGLIDAMRMRVAQDRQY